MDLYLLQFVFHSFEPLVVSIGRELPGGFKSLKSPVAPSSNSSLCFWRYWYTLVAFGVQLFKNRCINSLLISIRKLFSRYHTFDRKLYTHCLSIYFIMMMEQPL